MSMTQLVKEKNMYILKAKCDKMYIVGLYTTVATFVLYTIVVSCHYTIIATISLKLFQKAF